MITREQLKTAWDTTNSDACLDLAFELLKERDAALAELDRTHECLVAEQEMREAYRYIAAINDDSASIPASLDAVDADVRQLIGKKERPESADVRKLEQRINYLFQHLGLRG